MLWCMCVCTQEVQATLLTYEQFAATADSVVRSNRTSSGWATVRDGSRSLLIFDVDGVRVTLYREMGLPFDIIENTLPSQVGKPLSYGNRTIDVFGDMAPKALIMDLSDPCSGAPASRGVLSVDFGDFGRDEDKLLIELWSGLGATGELVGMAMATMDGRNDSDWTHMRLTARAPEGFASARIIGGNVDKDGNFTDHDVYSDRYWFVGDPDAVVPEDIDDPEVAGSPATIVFVPEPSAALVMVAGGLMLMHRRRRHAVG